MEIRIFWWKAAINLNSQVQINEWTESVTFLLRERYRSKSPVFPTSQFISTTQKLLKFIAVFTWPQPFTHDLHQYSAFLIHYFLYYPLNTASLHVELINFPYKVSWENLWIGISCFILPFFQILLLHLCYWEEICDELYN